MSTVTVTVTEEAKRQAALHLSHEGIWVRRDFWVNDRAIEVPEGDPNAVTRDFAYEVDYDRIVDLVVSHLCGDPHPADPTAPASAPDHAGVALTAGGPR